MDRRYAREHICYELMKHNIGRFTDVNIALGIVNRILGAMRAHGVIGDSVAQFVEMDGRKTLKVCWEGVHPCPDTDVEYELDLLVKEDAEGYKAIALVSTS